MAVLLLLLAVLAGPIALGLVAGRAGTPGASILFGLGVILPILLATALWFVERMTAHGGDLFGTYTDGDLGIIMALLGSPLLVPVSFGLVLLGGRLGAKPRSRTPD